MNPECITVRALRAQKFMALAPLSCVFVRIVSSNANQLEPQQTQLITYKYLIRQQWKRQSLTMHC